MKKALTPVALLVCAAGAGNPGDLLREPADPGLIVTARLLLQHRYTVSVAPDAPEPADDPAIGFDFRRLRPRLDFRAYDGKLVGVLQGEARGDENLLIDAWIDFNPDPSLRLRVGRFTPAFFREAIVSSGSQQAIDRTSIGNTINPNTNNRVEGVEIRLSPGPARLYLTLSEGVGLPINSFNAPASDWGATARVEVLLLGDSFSPFNQYTAPRGTPRGLLLGAAGHVQHLRGRGDRAAWTGDLSYQDSGFNAMLMVAGHIAEDRNSPPLADPESLYGVAGHIAWYVTDTVEPFVRYEWATTSDASHPDLNLITVGANWYVAGQALKFTVDASLAFDGVGPAFGRPVDGLIGTPGGETRFVFRAQAQVMF